jgi:hypothetical protein
MMHYQSNSCLCPGGRDYGHKMHLKIDRKALKCAKDRSNKVWMSEQGADTGHRVGKAIHAHACPASGKCLAIKYATAMVGAYYQKHSCLRIDLKGRSHIRHINFDKMIQGAMS